MRRGWFPGLFLALTHFASTSIAQAPGGPVRSNYYTVVVKINDVTVARQANPIFDPIETNRPVYVGDRVKVGLNSELALRRMDNSIARFHERSLFTIQAKSNGPPSSTSIQLSAGLMYLFHRDKRTETEIISGRTAAAVKGTEFSVSVDNGTMVVTVVDGEVELSNEVSNVSVKNGQQGTAVPGQAPTVRPALDVRTIIQWTLYYPGVLDTAELPLADAERRTLAASLDAYEKGDIKGAVAAYPDGGAPGSDADRIYRAALLLAVGKVDEAQGLLSAVARDGAVNARLAGALEELIAVVKEGAAGGINSPELATEWMVESYRQQAAIHLKEARLAALRASEKRPEFGFASARLAEMEFSYGNIDAAEKAVSNALRFSPANAQAVSLRGFLFAARNSMPVAIEQFNQAIALDGDLANAWLGRGLSRIRINDSLGGREDLLVAAALEPQRGFLRSYLAKAWTDAGERKKAEHELELAKDLDKRDATAWLYSALLKQQYNQINEAIHDLDHAGQLSTNRAVYRSQFLLDQDSAVRSANLAHIYRDAGMREWSVLEAGRAVASDYANYSAHLFLANSYDELRDPNRINLRYETAAESEYLIANLLAPVGAGTLSQSISQSEYSKLFERNRLGLVSKTEYLSRGAWYENGAQFGLFGNLSYSIEGIYRSDPGQRINNDFEERELRLHLKQQITPDDTIYLRVVDYEAVGGDRTQYTDPSFAHPGQRSRETQTPAIVAGYRHDWNPGSHLLFAASRFDDTYRFSDPGFLMYLRQEFMGALNVINPIYVNLDIETKLELYSAELQQIWETPKTTTVIGSRYQWEEFEVRPKNFDPGDNRGIFSQPPTLPESSPFMERIDLYAYETWRPIDSLSLIGGLSYNWLKAPDNLRSPPMNEEEQSLERVLPKAGFVFRPENKTVIRGAYTRSLGGASLDQSVRIEPTQVAGFNQAFRSIIPESVVGAQTGAGFETYNLSLERRFGSGTFVAAGGEILNSRFTRTDGAFVQDFFGRGPFAVSTTLTERINYRDHSLFLTADQLLGSEWLIGADYRLTESHLDNLFPEVTYEILPDDPFKGDAHRRSTLHQMDLKLVYNNPCGFFARWDAVWNRQNNRSDSAALPVEEFWQFDALAGYRFLHGRARVTMGLLNIFDTDYRLNPLVLSKETPRRRTIFTRLDISL